MARGVHPAGGEPALQVGDLLVHDAGDLVVVGLPVLDVALGAHHVEVSGHDDLGPSIAGGGQELGHAGVDELEVGVLLVHLLGAQLARVQVGGDDREPLDAVEAGEAQVGLEPAAGVDVGLLGAGRGHAVAQLAEGGGAALAHGDAHARTPLDAAGPDGGLVAGQEVDGDLLVGPDLLEQEDVGSGGGEPLPHALAGGGPDAVDVDGGDTHDGKPTRSALSLRR